MPFSRLEETFDEVNPSEPFVGRCFQRDAILRRKKSAGCVSTSPSSFLPAPVSVFVSMPLAPAKNPPQDGEVQSGNHKGSNYGEFKAQKSSNEEGEEKKSVD